MGNSGQSGFTLTEILVVSVIVAILAATAIPLYNGYVLDQRIAAARNIASSAAVSAKIIYRRTNTLPDCEADCVDALDLLLPEKDRYTVSLDKDKREITVTDLKDPAATAKVTF